MITKAIVEELISPYQVKVRIPLLDRTQDSPMSTSTDNLNVATFCTLPNCYMNVQVGDIVFVGFEDNTYYKAVILGHLCREAMSDTYPDVTLGNMSIKGSAQLPYETGIGDVYAPEIACLSGVRDNLQKQIDALKDELKSIQELIQGENN